MQLRFRKTRSNLSLLAMLVALTFMPQTSWGQIWSLKNFIKPSSPLTTPKRKTPEERCKAKGSEYYYDYEATSCNHYENGTLIWQGFHHEWDKTPHRLSQFGSYFKEIAFDKYAKTLDATHRSLFRVGAYEDVGTVKTTGTFVKSANLGFYQNYVDESCLTLTGLVGAYKTADCAIDVDLDEIGFSDYDQVTVILRGFQLKSKSYSSGYNTRGFTVRVIPDELHNGTYSFIAEMKVHPEHSPDRPQLDDKCWEDNHCERYKYEGRIYYTLVGVKSDKGHITDADSSNTNAFSQDVDIWPNQVPDEVSVETRTTSIQGESGLDHGLVAIQGFEWHLENYSQAETDGRYIRDLKMNVSNIDYDAASGEAIFQTNMFFHNSGLLPFGFNAEYKMWNALIQVNDKTFVKSDKAWFEGTVQSGENDFEEDVEYQF